MLLMKILKGSIHVRDNLGESAKQSRGQINELDFSLALESKKPALAGFFIISQRPIRLQLRLLQTDL